MSGMTSRPPSDADMDRDPAPNAGPEGPGAEFETDEAEDAAEAAAPLALAIDVGDAEPEAAPAAA